MPFTRTTALANRGEVLLRHLEDALMDLGDLDRRERASCARAIRAAAALVPSTDPQLMAGGFRAAAERLRGRKPGRAIGLQVVAVALEARDLGGPAARVAAGLADFVIDDARRQAGVETGSLQ